MTTWLDVELGRVFFHLVGLVFPPICPLGNDQIHIVKKYVNIHCRKWNIILQAFSFVMLLFFCLCFHVFCSLTACFIPCFYTFYNVSKSVQCFEYPYHWPFSNEDTYCIDNFLFRYSTRATQQKDATQKIRLFQTERCFKKHLKLERGSLLRDTPPNILLSYSS